MYIRNELSLNNTIAIMVVNHICLIGVYENHLWRSLVI